MASCARGRIETFNTPSGRRPITRTVISSPSVGSYSRSEGCKNNLYPSGVKIVVPTSFTCVTVPVRSLFSSRL